MIEGSLEVKLQTTWTDDKQRWEESEKRREERRREEKRREDKRREEKRRRREEERRKKIKKEKVLEERRSRCGKVAKHSVFPVICGSGESSQLAR